MRLFTGIVFLFVTTFVNAQTEPVTWTIEAEKITADEYEVSFTAQIQNGWSIYSPQVPEELGPVPTSFEFNPEGVQILGETKEAGQRKEDFDQTYGATFTKYLNRARFSQRIKVTSDTTSIKGQLHYMTCDANSCLPPADLPFVIDLD